MKTKKSEEKNLEKQKLQNEIQLQKEKLALQKKELKNLKKIRKSNPHKMLTKIILRIVSILLCAGILFASAYYFSGKFLKVRRENHIALVERQLFLCQELVTGKYRYSDIISLKKSLGFSKSYSIVKYSGIIRVGIKDLSHIPIDISKDRKSITLNIPKPEILGNEIVSQEVFDEKQSLFVPITTQEIFDEISLAKQEAQEQMISEGLLNEAYAYSVKIISQFMSNMGFEKIYIY